MEQDSPLRPALACIEVSSIARGIRMVDEMAKRATVRVLEASTICPGKYVVVVGGEVEMVREAHARGLEIAGPAIVDELLLPNAHPQLIPAIGAATSVDAVEALGVVETFAVASAIVAADAACKRADITLIELRLARGLGGKAFFTFTGPHSSVEASLSAATDAATRSGLLLRTELIPTPHPQLIRWLI